MMLEHAERIVSGASLHKTNPDTLDRIIRYIDGINQRQRRIFSPRTSRRRTPVRPSRRRLISRPNRRRTNFSPTDFVFE
ncbi:unnamed protein product [Gongylonema pulchrum]|uniref:Transposase n=1 Tax=Gongylonema pulchrum TaxID=637853 RepID=A0A183DGW6_9BILA|nr:unnamed protein product [Gongylonema pulchrum]